MPLNATKIYEISWNFSKIRKYVTYIHWHIWTILWSSPAHHFSHLFAGLSRRPRDLRRLESSRLRLRSRRRSCRDSGGWKRRCKDSNGHRSLVPVTPGLFLTKVWYEPWTNQQMNEDWWRCILWVKIGQINYSRKRKNITSPKTSSKTVLKKCQNHQNHSLEKCQNKNTAAKIHLPSPPLCGLLGQPVGLILSWSNDKCSLVIREPRLNNGK